MKTQAKYGFSVISSAFGRFLAILVPLLALNTPPRGCAQDDTVTISAARFQNLVYSAHVLSWLSENPELDASLQTLLELQRRNPQAEATALARALREAILLYRSTAPLHVRAYGSREEVLAAYLEAFRQVSARTNLIGANLNLLARFLLSPADYASGSAAELIHSGNRRLLSCEEESWKRQELLETCVSRASANSLFAAALDELLADEALVSWSDSPEQILSNTNSLLHDNPTMQSLLTISRASGDGSLTVSSNQLMTLFSAEANTFRNTINTNLVLQREFNRTYPDFLAYLTNRPGIDAYAQQVAAAQADQPRKLVAATAAVLVQSRLLEAKDPAIKVSRQMRSCVEGLHKLSDGLASLTDYDVGKIGRLGASVNILAGGLELINVFSGGETPEQEVLREVQNIKILLGDLSTNINFRFDRVDRSLTQIFDTLNTQFDYIKITEAAQGHLLVHLDQDVDAIRNELVKVQTDLHRLERHLLTYVNGLDRRGFKEKLNLYLGYETNHLDLPLPLSDYVAGENAFFTYAYDTAADELSCPSRDRDYSAEGLFHELTESAGSTITNRLDQNLRYIKKFLDGTLLPPGSTTAGDLDRVCNPRDWFVGAYAYLQLASENPLYFRTKTSGARLDLIAQRGNWLNDFLRSLAFTGTEINWNVRDALDRCYLQELTNFNAQVGLAEQHYAADRAFALDTWRRWSAAAPRVPTTVEVELNPVALLQPEQGAISVSRDHFLVLRPDGTVGDYGVGPDYGRPAVPARVTNVLAIAAGGTHSLALQPGGKVTGWGYNWSGQANTPAIATNVIRIAAGDLHSLALRGDTTVVGWGDNRTGQATGIATTAYPYCATGLVAVAGNTLSNVTAIVAGKNHSLALKADGIVTGWGENGSGQANGPLAGTNVLAIAVGLNHSLALKNDHTVVVWGDNRFGQTNTPSGLTRVVAIAAGDNHSVALLENTTVVAWGHNSVGQSTVPRRLTNVVAVAAGGNYSIAIKSDGSVVGWGETFLGHGPIPKGLKVVGISAGQSHNLALRADGTVVGWGENAEGRATGWQNPASPFEGLVQAGGGLLGDTIAVAAGGYHNLALKANGTVVSWGDNDYGQTNVPAGLAKVVAVAAGFWHSLALRDDGTVVGWGYNRDNEANGAVAGSNVVAIAAGYRYSLALKADSTVVAWGYNDQGKTNVPAGLANVVALAAGFGHCLALRANGTVVSWGANSYGQTNCPSSATNVVAIAAGYNHNLALRGDGTVVAWGDPYFGQTIVPPAATNVVAISAGRDHSLFLVASGTTDSIDYGEPFIVRAQVPWRVGDLIAGATGFVRTNLTLDLHQAGVALSGSKALLTAVLELSLPFTLEQDEVLRGFIYGSESLIDLEAADAFLLEEDAVLRARPDAKPLSLTEVGRLRYARFSQRLTNRLNDLKAAGQPELPRLVGHTLRLLSLLRDAREATPPPTLECLNDGNLPRFLLFAEPYIHYGLQYTDNLTAPNWASTTTTNLHDCVSILPPLGNAPHRFYRTVLIFP